jgi:hypothetical protein
VIPLSPGETSRAAGPFAALSLRSERLLRAGSLRRLAYAVPARNPSTIAVRTSGPHLTPAQRAFPTSESSCVRQGRGPVPADRVLRPTPPHETVCPGAARRRNACRRRDGDGPPCPTGGMLEGGQPIRLDIQRTHRPARPHRYSHSPSNLKVRPPAGGRPSSGRPTNRPGGVHVRCRWCGSMAAGSACPMRRHRLVSKALSE